MRQSLAQCHVSLLISTVHWHVRYSWSIFGEQASFYAKGMMTNHWMVTLSNITDLQSRRRTLSRDRECALNIHINCLGSEKALFLTGIQNNFALQIWSSCRLKLLLTFDYVHFRTHLMEREKSQILQDVLSEWERGKSKCPLTSSLMMSVSSDSCVHVSLHFEAFIVSVSSQSGGKKKMSFKHHFKNV